MTNKKLLKLITDAVNDLDYNHQASAIQKIETALIHHPNSIDLISLKVDIVTNLPKDAHDDLLTLKHDLIVRRFN